MAVIKCENQALAVGTSLMGTGCNLLSDVLKRCAPGMVWVLLSQRREVSPGPSLNICKPKATEAVLCGSFYLVVVAAFENFCGRCLWIWFKL